MSGESEAKKPSIKEGKDDEARWGRAAAAPSCEITIRPSAQKVYETQKVKGRISTRNKISTLNFSEDATAPHPRSNRGRFIRVEGEVSTGKRRC